MRLLEYLLVGVATGWIVGKMRRGKGHGFWKNLVIGGVGSFAGWFLMGFLSIHSQNIIAQLAMAVAGASLLFFLKATLKWKKKKKKEEDE